MSTNASEPSEVTAPDHQNGASTELDAFNRIVAAVKSVPAEGQMRLVKSVLTFLGWTDPIGTRPDASIQIKAIDSTTKSNAFSEDRTPSPKEFMLQKRPMTDIEKVTCLAYYLTHFRETPHFKTLDLSKLNTEAAQIKLSNPTVAVDNATKAGLLVPAAKGNKQISALGELYVQALPDRDLAKSAIAHARPRRKTRRGNASRRDNGDASEVTEDQ